jgi:hypothetical protein
LALNDPEVVAREYAAETGLEARRAAYRYSTGPDAVELTYDAVVEAAPADVLEVGCGPGDLAARILATGATVRAVERFAAVEERDAGGEIRFPDRASVQAYIDATTTLWPRGSGELPAFETPFVVMRAPVVFVATKDEPSPAASPRSGEAAYAAAGSERCSTYTPGPVPSGIGSPSAAIAWRWKAMASSMSATHSSTVSPAPAHPRRSGDQAE